MTKEAPPREKTLWEQLPKAEQERIKRELDGMRNEAPKVAPKNGKGTFTLKGYVRCELSVSDKDSFRQWELEAIPAEAYERLIKLVDSGYLLKVGEAGNGYQASICAATTNQGWNGYVLTAHAGTGIRSVLLLLYKHDLLMQGDWAPFLTDEGEDALR